MLLRSRWFTIAPWRRQPGFTFLPTECLIDAELELVSPSPQWINAVLASAEHPQTRQMEPVLGHISRRQLNDFLGCARRPPAS